MSKGWLKEINIKERPYLVVVWCEECGSDEKMDFDSLVEAFKDAKRYQEEWDYAAVYVRDQKKAYVVFGDVDTPVFADWVSVVRLEYT